MTTLRITNARIVDPASDGERNGMLAVLNGRIVDADTPLPDGSPVIDAQGACLAPGIIDFGVFATDKPAFHFGGITRAILMPDGSLPLDQPSLVERTAKAGKPDLWVHPMAAATKGLVGVELAEMGLMQRAGAVAVATGRQRIAHSGVMRHVLSYAAARDLVVVTHAEDEGLTEGAVATDGEGATILGLPSAPAEAEAMAVARDVSLAALTGARLHFRQVTTAAALTLIRAAKASGLPVTCGITPAHLFLNDHAIQDFRTFARLSPPLRSERDRLACLEAIADGTIDVIASGHDPRGPEDKRLPFAEAAPGMAGAETLLALSLSLVRDGVVSLPRLFQLLSGNPARICGTGGGALSSGAEADLILFDPDAPWRVDSDRMSAAAGNTPFDGLPVQGRVLRVWKGGAEVGKSA